MGIARSVALCWWQTNAVAGSPKTARPRFCELSEDCSLASFRWPPANLATVRGTVAEAWEGGEAMLLGEATQPKL